MRCLVTVAVFVIASMSQGGSARAELEPATKTGAFRRDIERRLCFAGRFRFEQSLPNHQIYVARCIEQIISCGGHPNASPLGELTLVLPSKKSFIPENGRIYCLIVTAGSKRGWTVEAFGPDDAATLQEMKVIMGSSSAFQNDATWQKRRALWAKLRNDLGTEEAMLLYCEDDALRNILYVKKGDEPFPIHLYHSATGRSEPVVHAKTIRGANRITFEEGHFHVWFDGSIELTIDPGGEQ